MKKDLTQQNKKNDSLRTLLKGYLMKKIEFQMLKKIKFVVVMKKIGSDSLQ